MKKQITLSVIVPCYNESTRLDVQIFKDFIEFRKDIKFCFVNDGSTDRTQEILTYISQLCNDVIVINLVENVGKAEAVRQGSLYMLANFNCEYVGFIDADLAAPLTELEIMLDNLVSNSNSIDGIFGSRVALLGMSIKRSAFRHYSGRMIATIISIILDEIIYDTQCGLKIFKADLAQLVFFERFQTKWLFDVEIFARLKKIHGPLNRKLSECICEKPLLIWRDPGDSRIKLLEILLLPIDILKIYYYYRWKK